MIFSDMLYRFSHLKKNDVRRQVETRARIVLLSR